MLKDIDLAMPMYNVIEYSDAYSTTSESLWQHYRDEPALDANHNIIDFPANDRKSNSFRFKQQLTGQTGNYDTKDVEIMVTLKYLSNFWRTLEMPLLVAKLLFSLHVLKKSIPVTGTTANEVPKFRITNTKLYVPVVTLSTQENIKLLKQLESGVKRTINWNKYQSKKQVELKTSIQIF